MILEILLAAAPSAAGGGGGGGGAPFVLTGASHAQTLSGTSCGNPAQFTVEWTSTGSPTGKTVDIYILWGPTEELALAGVDASYGIASAVPGLGYWSKFEDLVTVQFRVEDSSDATNDATSSATSSAYHNCGV